MKALPGRWRLCTTLGAGSGVQGRRSLMLSLILLIQLTPAEVGAAPPEAPPPVTTPQYLGSLDKETIRTTVQKSGMKIRACYERFLGTSGLVGKVVVFWKIDSSGAVPSASIEETSVVPRDQDFEACVANVVREMEFPPPKGGGIVLVHYPFVFTLPEPQTGRLPQRGSENRDPAPPPPQEDLTGPVTLVLFGVAIAAIVAVAATLVVVSAQPTR